MAIAALVSGLVGWVFCGVGSILAIVFGFMARNQIARSDDGEEGRGMALAGIVLGFLGLGLFLLLITLAVATSDG